MPSVNEMRNWNYARAWTYFIKEQRLASEEVRQYFRYIARKGMLFDIRNEKMDMRFMNAKAKQGTLFIVDGCSCTGKSTFAKKMAEKFNANVVDIDLVCIEFMKAKEKELSKNQFFWFLMNFDELSDKYLYDNIERIVREASEGGTKSVFLVGMFMEFVHRAILGTIMGKYFNGGVVGFVMHEPMEVIKGRRKMRDKEFGTNFSNGIENKSLMADPMFENDFKSYEFLEKVLADINQTAFLVLGMDFVFIVNSKTEF